MRNNHDAEYFLHWTRAAAGAISFSQPSGLSAAGDWIYLCDRGHNRILGWRGSRALTRAADMVLGQPDAESAEPGGSRHGLNWPCGVTAAAKILAVADTWNDRLLLWMPRPESAREPDLILPVKRPWDVWTDGARLAVAAEGEGALLLWRSLPSSSASAPDARLDAVGQMRSPRSIATDGTTWMVGDARSGSSGGPQGNFVWRALTGDSQAHDLFLPRLPGSPLWLQGSGDASGFWLVGGDLMHWRSAPDSETAAPDLRVRGLSAGLLPGADTCVTREVLLVSQPEQNRVGALPRQPAGGFGTRLHAYGTSPASPEMWGMRLAAGDGWLAAVDSRSKRIRTWVNVAPDAPNTTLETELPYGAAAAWAGTLLAACDTKLDVFTFTPAGLRPARPSEVSLQGLSGLPAIGSIACDGPTLAVAAAEGPLVLLFRRQRAGWRPCGRLFTAGAAQLGLSGEWLAVSAGSRANLHRLGPTGEPSRGQPLKLPTGSSASAIALRGEALVVVDSERNEALGWQSVTAAAAGGNPDWRSGDAAGPGAPGIGRRRLAHPSSVALTSGHALVAESSVSCRIAAYRCRP